MSLLFEEIKRSYKAPLAIFVLTVIRLNRNDDVDLIDTILKMSSNERKRLGIYYYGFDHEAGYISDDIECIFPNMIQHSLAMGLDVSNTDFYGDVWDKDW